MQKIVWMVLLPIGMMAMQKHVPLEDQDRQKIFDLTWYPTAKQNREIFEVAKKNNESPEALITLLALADDPRYPYVPAMRELALVASRKNLDDAAVAWSKRGAWYGDPRSASTMAELYRKNPRPPSLEKLDPLEREVTIKHALEIAAKKYQWLMPRGSGNFLAHLAVPDADKDLESFMKEYPQRIQKIFDTRLEGNDVQRMLVEKKLQESASELVTPELNFFIKKYAPYATGDAVQGIPHDPECALSFAQQMMEVIQDPLFNIEYFDAGRVREALEKIAAQTSPTRKAKAEELMERLGQITQEKLNAVPDKKEQEIQASSLDDLKALFFLADQCKPEQQLKYYNQVITGLPPSLDDDGIALVKETLTKLDALPQDNNQAILDALLQLTKTDGFKSLRKTAGNGGSLHACADQLDQRLTVAKGSLSSNKNKKITMTIDSLLKDAQSEVVPAGWRILAREKPNGQTVKKFIELLEKNSLCVSDQAMIMDAVNNLIAHAHNFDDTQRAEFDVAIKRLLQSKDTLFCTKIVTACLKDTGKTSTEYAALAMREYCKHIMGDDWPAEYCADVTSGWVTHAESISAILNQFKKKADEGDCCAASLVADFLMTYGAFFKHPDFCGKEKSFIDTSITGVMNAASRSAAAPHVSKRDFEALCQLIPCCQNLASHFPSGQLAPFWYRVWDACEDIPERKEVKMQALNSMKQLAQRWVNPHFDKERAPQTLSDNYYAMMTLAEADPLQALKRFGIAEKYIIDKRAKNEEPALKDIARNVGAYDCLVKYATNGNGWVWYALAVYNYTRLPLIHITDLGLYIRSLEEICTMIEKAASAERPCTTFEIVSPGSVYYILGMVYEKSAQNSFDLAVQQKERERMLQCYDTASDYGHNAASYEYANGILTTLISKTGGQPVLEKAINRLMKAAKANNEPAGSLLKKISKEAYTFMAPCGGIITIPLLESMRQTVASLDPDAGLYIVEDPANSVQDSLIHDRPQTSNVAKAIRCFEEKKYPEAYTLFCQCQNDPRSLIYLGMMHRDALIEQASPEQKSAYFKKALFGWNGDCNSIHFLNIPYEGLFKESSYDLEACIARLSLSVKFGLHCRDDRYLEVCKSLQKAEALACKSSKSAEQNLLFTTGVAHNLGMLCARNPSGPFLCDVVLQFASRIAAVGLPRDEEYKKDIMAPFDLLREKLMNFFIEFHVDSPFTDVEKKVVTQLIQSLETLVEKRNMRSLCGLLGSLHIEGATLKIPEASITKGLKYLQAGHESGDDRATIMSAFFDYKGREIIHKSIPYAPKAAKQKLEKLRAKKFLPATRHLGIMYITEKNYEAAESCFNELFKHDANDGETALHLAICACSAPSLQADKADKIIKLLDAAQGEHPKLKVAIQLYKGYCLAVKNGNFCPSLESLACLQEGLKNLVNNAPGTKAFVELSTCNKLEEKLSRWCNNNIVGKKVPAENKELYLQAYLTLAQWRLACARYIVSQPGLEGSAIREYNKFKSCLENVLAISEQSSVTALHLFASYYFDHAHAETNYDLAKTYLLKACKAMGEQKLTFADHPLVHSLVLDLKRQLIVLQNNRILPRYGIKDPASDLKLIEVLEKKYNGLNNT